MTSSRKECLTGEVECAPKSKREALYCQINHSQMSRAEIAEVMKINPATLSKWGDPQGDDNIPEERLLHLLQLTDDNPAFVTFFAHLQGFVVYDPKSAGADVTRLVTEFGDLLKAIDTRGDGTTVEEADRIEREGNQLIVAVRRAIEDARAAAPDPSMPVSYSVRYSNGEPR